MVHNWGRRKEEYRNSEEGMVLEELQEESGGIMAFGEAFLDPLQKKV